MRTQITFYVVLLSVAPGLTALAASLTLNTATQQSEAAATTAPHQKPLASPVPPRGQMLYENHCTACHESLVHIREDRRTRSPAELRGRVAHWAGYLRLGWRGEDVDEVAAYLDARYYKFDSR